MFFIKTKKTQIYKKNISSKMRGFSLIEVLVTLLVLTVGLTMIAVMMGKNIKSTINSRNQIVASELAQEGVELVQNLNDNAVVGSPLAAGNKFTIDHGGTLSAPNTTAAQERLNLASGGFYNHGTGTPTKYFRKIDISVNGTGSGSQLSVTSTVSWNNSDIPSAAQCSIANKCLSVTAIMIAK